MRIIIDLNGYTLSKVQELADYSKRSRKRMLEFIIEKEVQSK